jgi:hypothetical protein
VVDFEASDMDFWTEERTIPVGAGSAGIRSTDSILSLEPVSYLSSYYWMRLLFCPSVCLVDCMYLLL